MVQKNRKDINMATLEPNILADYIPNTLFSLSGQTAVVVGVGGLGKIAAIGLAAAGARLAVADIDENRAKEVAGEINGSGGQAEAYVVDVTRKSSVDNLFSEVIERMGRIHVSLNTSGISVRGNAEDFEESDWDKIIDVNLKGTFLCCQAAGRHMLEQGGGSIINFSSIAGSAGIGKTPAYSASKGGVNQITIALAVDWADRGVRVNAVAPSYFETEIFTKAFEKDMGAVLDERLKKIPMGRLGQPPELVGAIVFLASPAASMITGVILPVDGGFLAA
jgi:NAD(P)-dependent dehydrogenase (short-subunit alcohol dehydrogenase family)